jgi:hypothetical protein
MQTVLAGRGVGAEKGGRERHLRKGLDFGNRSEFKFSLLDSLVVDHRQHLILQQ